MGKLTYADCGEFFISTRRILRARGIGNHDGGGRKNVGMWDVKISIWLFDELYAFLFELEFMK